MMKRDWLERQLAAGRSIESIAREVGRSASAVAYWVNKFGLISQHAERVASKRPIDEGELRALVEEGKSVREIGEALGLGATSVRHWLRKWGLQTRPARYSRRDEQKPEEVLRECSVHEWVNFRRIGGTGHFRCPHCAAQSVTDRRRRVKEILVAEAGGRCILCGYDRFAGALQFHHMDPATKSFGLSLSGLGRSLEKMRAEAAKCVLLCATCHAEVEGGVSRLPFRGAFPG